ncbi:AAA family ATPase [Listeria sp. FSL L7-1582]|uniref:ParA family protein n=1 Tax=Listeria portnoyi TaxID=2713504 RepID=UPI00164E99FD|nr:AAA family ATPase [Listeria portnoyi]MBC6308223.1 AAA family ATPase [Listeria portnoyi]
MKAKVISIFNHKGGVSKTTSTYNIGWKLAEIGKKVLFVDADPQCNLTGLILGDDFEEYYTDGNGNNIKDAVRSAFEGKPVPIKPIECYTPIENENIYLIPGHMDLSEYDPSLSLALNSNNSISTLQNLPGSFYELIKLCSEKYDIDYVFVDMNPGLSAINQTLFVSSDGFIVPTNPDPFSIMALQTMLKILPRWKKWAEDSRSFFEEATYPLPNKDMRFIGEIIQRFNLRNKKAANAYVPKIKEIKTFIEGDFLSKLEQVEMVYDITMLIEKGLVEGYCLAEISDFGALLPKSHKYKVPVYALSDNQMEQKGKVLGQMKTARDRFNTHFENIAAVIVELVK